MKKNINKPTVVKTSGYNSNYIEFPAVVNMDKLCFFDDDSLEKLHSNLRAERDSAFRYTDNLTPWEVEICYIQREIRIRSLRRVTHDTYIRNNPDAYYYENSGSQAEYEKNTN